MEINKDNIVKISGRRITATQAFIKRGKYEL